MDIGICSLEFIDITLTPDPYEIQFNLQIIY